MAKRYEPYFWRQEKKVYNPVPKCGNCKHFIPKGKGQPGVCELHPSVRVRPYFTAEELECENWERFKMKLPTLGLNCDTPVSIENVAYVLSQSQ